MILKINHEHWTYSYRAPEYAAGWRMRACHSHLRQTRSWEKGTCSCCGTGGGRGQERVSYRRAKTRSTSWIYWRTTASSQWKNWMKSSIILWIVAIVWFCPKEDCQHRREVLINMSLLILFFTKFPFRYPESWPVGFTGLWEPSTCTCWR